MAPVFTDCADGTDTHLVRSTEQLQGLLVLRADLPVQVPQFVHQLVPFERGRLVMRPQVLLAVRCQAVQAGLHSFEFLSRAEVTRDVAWPGVDVPLGRAQVDVQAALLDLLGHHAESGVGSQHGPLGERDLTLGTDVNTCVVSLVPVAADAVHAETVATGDGHRVSEEVRTQGAVEVIRRRVISHCGGVQTRSDPWKLTE